jgi:hypothetical protein
MINKKAKDPKLEKRRTRFIFGREKSEDGLVRALKRMCKEAGIKFIPSKKKK